MKKIHSIIAALAFILLVVQCNTGTSNTSNQSDALALNADTQEKPNVKQVVKTEAEWKKQLTDAEFNVLRKAGTERAFTGDLLENKDAGIYVCAACKHPLFSSETKFESGTGWPSFYAPVSDTAIVEKTDEGFGMTRTEILCAKCNGHQGHVFKDGPNPTGLRYCINSVSLDFEAQ